MRLNTAVNKVRDSIFQVQVIEKTDNIPKISSLGTAFAVDDNGLLVTAKHVVDEAVKRGGNLIVAFAGRPSEKDSLQIHGALFGVGAEVVGIDDKSDIALLKINSKLSDLKITVGNEKNETTPKVINLNKLKPNDGDEIAITGYPLNEPSMVTTAGHLASNWSLDNGNERYLGDLTCNGGNSGGPVYSLKDAAVIGVCVAYKNAITRHLITGEELPLTHNSGLTVITPSSKVVEMITNYKNKS